MKIPPIRRSVVSVLACASLGGALAGTYTLTDLGTGSAVDINRSGWVVGTDLPYFNGGAANRGGWLYDGTNRTTLGFGIYSVENPRGVVLISYTEPAAISDAGRVIGMGFQDSSGIRLAFFYDQIGGGRVLGTSDVYGVNASGVIVGSGYQYDGTSAVILNGPYATGRAINTSGQVVGLIRMPGGVFKAASFGGGTNALLDLSAVEATIPSPQESGAFSINDSGQVVGYVRQGGGATADHPAAAYLWTTDGMMETG